jgi:hypothetical protein
MVLMDARKEFEGDTRVGFGIDGHADEDFAAVRGTFEGNAFVKKLKQEMQRIEERHAELARRVV